MAHALRRRSAALLALLFACAPLLSAAAQGEPSLGGAVAGPSALRTPDFDSLDSAPDGVPVAPTPRPRPMAAGPTVNWTVLVYMVADNDLEAYGIEDINEMEAAPTSSEVNVVVQVDRSSRYDESNGDWQTTRRYAVAHDADAATIGSTLLADLGEVNMGDPQALVDFLAWGVDQYPALHYLVVLWDHGFGWSAGFGNDLGNGDHLTLSELDAAMRLAAEHLGRPFDILAFDACIMQQVEVVYEMAWVADYFVGAENLEPVTGWVYDQMLAPALEDPTISPRAFSSALAQAYMDYYGLQRDEMMSAVDARLLRTTLSAAMNRLAGELSAAVEDPAAMGDNSAERAIIAARDLAPAMFNVDYIDLGDFARRLEEDARIPAAARQGARDVRAALNLTVFAEVHTVYRPNITGLSVYLPSSSLPVRYLSTRWANDSFWDEFVVAYLSGVPTAALEPRVSVAWPPEGTTLSRNFFGALTGNTTAGAPLALEYKAGWGNWTTIDSGPGNLTSAGALDAGARLGPTVLSFRAVDGQGHPSATVERNVTLVPDPVTLSPQPNEVALAVGRTSVVAVVATLRAPFTGFTVSWRHLPSGVSNSGTTTFTAPGPAPVPPFNVNLSLAAAGGAAEGLYPVELVAEAVGEPGVETVLWITLNLTRPLADAAVEPLRPDDPLPLPAQVVQVTTNVTNIGFDNLAGARIVARVDGPSPSELLNLSWGALAPGQSVPIAFNFTADYGLQVVTVSAFPEPGQEELQVTNNVRTLTINISRFLVEVEAPQSRVQVEQVGATTPVSFTVFNRGTDDDNYTFTAGSISGTGWGIGLPASPLQLAARTLASVVVNVTSPTPAEGGTSLTFGLIATSQGDSSVSSTALVTVEILEVFNASVTLSRDDIEVPYRGNISVEATVLNRGNGHETFSLSVQQGDASLGTASNASVLTLAPGGAALVNLTLRDLGLLSTERPYVLELVAIAQTSGARFSGILPVRVEPHAEVTISGIERSLVLSATDLTAFHVNLTNIGNTNAVVALTATTSQPQIIANITATGALLLPGGTMVVNGTASLGGLPPAGSYAITVRAVETRTNQSALANVSVIVPAVHEIVASLGPGLTPPPTPRTQTVTITIENRGNVLEVVDVILGFIRVDVRVTLSPAAGRISMPPFSNATVEVFIVPTSGAAYSGQVPVELYVVSTGTTVPVSVPYTFAPDSGDTSLLWIIATGGAAAAFAGYLVVRRAAARAKVQAGETQEAPTSKPPP